MQKIASIICSLTFFLNALLHLFLTAGFPLGKFVFGGEYDIFPPKLRFMSAFLCLLWSLYSATYLIYGKIIQVKTNKRILNFKLNVMTIFLFLASIFNIFITTSFFEKYFTGTLSSITFVLSALSLIHI
nr:hypothetical protein [Enterococcus sp. 4G2_DIV0659]